MTLVAAKVTLVPDSDPRWQKAREGDIDARNSIIADSTQLLEQVAAVVKRKLPEFVDIEDLKSYGAIGLIKAVDTYDPERASFRTHAVFLIKNRIYDELRNQDWAPKSMRDKVKIVETARQELMETLGRAPTADEIGQALGQDAVYVRSLAVEADNSPVSLTEIHDDTVKISSVETLYEARRCMARMAVWVDTLTDLQQAVWALIHYRDLTPQAAARRLGLPRRDVVATLAEINESFALFVEDLRAS